MKHVLTLLVFLLVAKFQPVLADVDPSEFFQKFVKLSHNFDATLAELYLDSAKIHAYRVYPHGLERNKELTGAQWKELVLKIMPLAKLKNDKSTFSNIAISKHNSDYKIKADRYSVRKCYTDSGYYMVVSPNAYGELRIVEEYLETKPLPDC